MKDDSPEAPALHGPSTPHPALRRRLNTWLAARMSRRVGAWTGMLTMTALVTGLSVSVGTSVWNLLHQAELTQQRQVEAGAEALEKRLDDIAAESEAIAGSSLVANALSDSAGREEYLLPLLRDRPMRVRYGAAVTLCDAQGHVVGSTDAAVAGESPSRQGPNAGCGPARDFAAVLVSGHGRVILPEARDGPQRFFFLDPVRLPGTGTVEGALVVRVDADALIHPAQGQDLGRATLVRTAVAGVDESAIVRPIRLPKQAESAIGALVVSMPKDTAPAIVPWGWTLASHLLLVLLLTAPAVGLAAWLGRRMAEPVVALGELAQSPQGGTPAAWSPLAARQDEVGQAAGHLQRLTTQLNEQLEHLETARVEADAANRAKSDFLAAMSHEIRTPLNAVIGLTALAADCEGAPQRDLLAQARRSADHLLALVNRVLDMARIDSGRLEIEHRPVSLLSVLSTTRSHVEAAARAKGLALSFETAPDVPGTLVCDETWLTEVLTNLASNAVKFTAQGSVTVQVRVQMAVPDGDERLIVEVTDTGIGIAPEQQERIFEPFTQADAGTARHYGGTGLGLALSRRLVERMHGRLSVQSRLGQGATFRVDLPLLRAAAEALGSATQDGTRVMDRSLLEQEVRRRVGDRAVLVVDDDEVNRLLAGLMLEQFGLRAVAAADGESALQMLGGTGDIALVLMDCHLPGMDGFEITRQLRAQPALNALPVIACTADVLTESLESCLAAGMNDYVSKPLEPLALLAAMARCLQRGAALPRHAPA